jgi:tetratricopeptide (TPR) repeat protein
MDIKPSTSQAPIVRPNDQTQIDATQVNKSGEQVENTAKENSENSPQQFQAMKHAGTEKKGTMKAGEHYLQHALSNQLDARPGPSKLLGWPDSQNTNTPALLSSQVMSSQTQSAPVTSSAKTNAPAQATSTAQAEASKQLEKGKAAFKSGNYQEALQAFLKADELYPHPNFKYNQAASLEKLGKQELAAAKYQTYLADNPSSPDAEKVRSHITKLRGEATKAAQTAFDKGQAAYAAGNYKEAAAAFTEAYEHKPNPEFLYNIGASYDKAGDTKQAIKNYQLYVNMHPDAKDADKVRTHMHRLQKKTGDELMQPDPMKAGQQAFDIGKSDFKAGSFKEAAAAFTEAYKHTRNPDILYNIGASYEKAGDTKEAIKHYQRYLNEHPDAKDADKVRSHIHRLQKKTGDELMRPDSMKAAQEAFDRGTDAYNAGRFKAAAAAFTEAYDHEPKPELLYNIGAAYQRAGDTKQAIKHYQLYLNNHPDAKDADQVRKMIDKLQQRTGDDLMKP